MFKARKRHNSNKMVYVWGGPVHTSFVGSTTPTPTKKETYAEYLRSDHWKNLRRKKYSTGNARCSICGSKDSLEVHHLNYKNLYDVTTSDLRILCHDCHFTAHKLFRKGKIKFHGTSHHSRFAIIKNAVKRFNRNSTRPPGPKTTPVSLPTRKKQADLDLLFSETPLIDRVLLISKTLTDHK